jgi:POTRA domain, FtsQ-type
MRDRRGTQPSMIGARPRGLRFAFRPPRNGSSRRAPREGRLGVDLRGQPGTQRDALDAPFRAAARPRLRKSWSPTATTSRGGNPLNGARRARRRVFPSPAVTLLLAAQVAILIVAGWALTSPAWEARQVVVEGTRDQTLVAAIEALPLTGCNIFRCDLADRIRRVEALPAVASADVQAVFPDTLEIVVTPRTPALLLHTGGGSYVVADDGVVLGTPHDAPAWNVAALPALDYPDGAPAGGAPLAAGTRLDATVVNLAAQLRRGLHEAFDDAWALRYGRDDGFTATGPGGAQVRFGTARDVASAAGGDLSAATLGGAPDLARVSRGVTAQLAELRAILKALSDRGQRAALIDLRWGSHPYVRLGG